MIIVPFLLLSSWEYNSLFRRLVVSISFEPSGFLTLLLHLIVIVLLEKGEISLHDARSFLQGKNHPFVWCWVQIFVQWRCICHAPHWSSWRLWFMAVICLVSWDDYGVEICCEYFSLLWIVVRRTSNTLNTRNKRARQVWLSFLGMTLTGQLFHQEWEFLFAYTTKREPDRNMTIVVLHSYLC